MITLSEDILRNEALSSIEQQLCLYGVSWSTSSTVDIIINIAALVTPSVKIVNCYGKFRRIAP